MNSHVHSTPDDTHQCPTGPQTDHRRATTTTLSQMLRSQTGATPHHTAVSDPVRSFDYQTLDTLADKVATSLLDRGVKPGDPVGVIGVRDARLIVAMHGIFRAGCIAVVTDPTWPTAELHRRLTAVSATAAVATEPTLEPFTPTVHLDIDILATEPADHQLHPETTPRGDDIAYLTFTSGSAGPAKAVAISHANAVHYAHAIRERLGFGTDTATCFGHATTLAADLGHTSWLLALTVGGRVHVMDDLSVRDPHRFWESVCQAHVTTIKTTPSHIAALLDSRPDPVTLDTLILGGEALPTTLARELLASRAATRIVNHYGPTETTIGAICFIATHMRDLPPDEQTVPIGYPLGRGSVLLRRPDGSRTPAQSSGELFIGGPGVTPGYLGESSQAHRFVTIDGQRMYRTGDICRIRPDGALVFLHRSDRQTKISGYLVDPDGIERILQSCPGVAQSAVLVRHTPSGPRLGAAVRWTDAHPSENAVGDLLRVLNNRLPPHAVPAPILALPSFPISPNGKLDRRHLAHIVACEAARRARSGRFVPQTPGMKHTFPPERISAFWARELGLPAIDVHTDIFAAGGDSLLAMRTVSFLYRAGRNVTVEHIYRNPSAATLALINVGSDEPDESRPGTSQEPAHLALGPPQRWFFRQPIDDRDHWNQAVLLHCTAAIDPTALCETVVRVLARHPVLYRPLSATGPTNPHRSAREIDAVSFSPLPSSVTLERHIAEMSTELHRSLDISAGRLIRFHLFRSRHSRTDRLVIVAHHLVMDAMSWRILLHDIADSYRSVVTGDTLELPPPDDYYHWASSLDTPPDPPVRAQPDREPHRSSCAPAAITIDFDRDMTTRLTEEFGRGSGLEALLLSAFGAAIGRTLSRPLVPIEVETHGRESASRHGHHYLDTIGWFTAVRRIEVDPAHIDDVAAARQLHAATIQRLDHTLAPAEFGFNFLGAFHLPEEELLGWRVASETGGLARCPSGDPLYRCRLTARLTEQRLVADLVYQSDSLTHSQASQVLTSIGSAIAGHVGAPSRRPVKAPASTSGQLLLAGHRRRPHRPEATTASKVLLTGATGYLGKHILRQLLARGTHVTCLVRASTDQEARTRLDTADASTYAVAGDITREGLGLSTRGTRLARQATILIHAAADVRLIAPPDEIETTNVEAVRNILRWIDGGSGPVAIHHLSTLAVMGHTEHPPPRFTENDLDIGQTFQLPYERTKFAAEKLIREWGHHGHQWHAYRSGHIAAHSRTGAFQQNIGDNRIYQLLRGYVLAGAAPHDWQDFAFSHVDTVAAAIAAIALSGTVAPGVHHVETPYTITHSDMIRHLVNFGYHIRSVDHIEFSAAISRVLELNPRVGHEILHWTNHPRRAGIIDSRKTLELLHRLDIHFAAPSAKWCAAALTHAVQVGFLPPPHSGHGHTTLG